MFFPQSPRFWFRLMVATLAPVSGNAPAPPPSAAGLQPSGGSFLGLAACLGLTAWLALLAPSPLVRTAHAADPAAVVYAQVRNGEIAAGEGHRVLVREGGLARIFQELDGTRIATAPEELDYFDLANRRTLETARFPDGTRATVVTAFDSLPQFLVTDETEEILGFECRKATTEIRSNQITVWFTDSAGIVGSPSLRLFVPDALVLRMDQNGTQGFLAQSIVTDPDTVRELLEHQPTPFAPASWGDEVDDSEYRTRVTNSYVTTVKVFENEQISFGNEIEIPANPEDGATCHYANGTVIVRKVTLPEMGDDVMVLAELTERSNGDAYDRTGSVFLIPTDRALSFLDALRDGVGVLPVIHGREGEYQGIAATEDYLPPLELIRFITPFGVGHFNDRSRVRGLEWANDAGYVMDLTDLLPRLAGDVWIGAFIGNYDKGGHVVSLDLRYYPWSQVESTGPKTERWTLPVFNTLNAMEMAGQNYGTIFASDTLRVDFDAAPGLTNCQLRYITTGHGGWGGGDEFNLRTNEILLDGARVAHFVPWRSDCGTFRERNPSSGNFWNGLSSSDFSRSGWCPGTTVSPVIVPLDDLAPGRHRIEVIIPMGPREGGSFSSWNVSGVLLGEFARP